MDFKFNDEQLAIAGAASRVFSDLCSDDDIKALSQSRAPIHKELWKQLAETGILGLVVPEEYDGMGMTLIELCLVLEAQGKHVAPVPLIAHLVESVMVLSASNNDKLKQELLPLTVTGEKIICPVSTYIGVQDANPLKAFKEADACILNGRSSFVPYAALASGFIVSVKDESNEDLVFYCDSNTSGITITEQRGINDESAGYLTFTNVKISNENFLAQGESAKPLIQQQQHNTWIALAALQIGVLDEGLKRAADYVSERKQFGRPLGKFQAVSQRAADAYMEIESLRSVYWRALDDIEQQQDYSLSAAVSKYWVGTAGHKVAHAFLHLHGGIGQDLDYPIHRYFLWAKFCERYLGSPDKFTQIVGSTVVSQLDNIFEGR